jgi:hypothetical protein
MSEVNGRTSLWLRKLSLNLASGVGYYGTCPGEEAEGRTLIVRKYDRLKTLNRKQVRQNWNWWGKQGSEHEDLWAIRESLNFLLKTIERFEAGEWYAIKFYIKRLEWKPSWLLWREWNETLVVKTFVHPAPSFPAVLVNRLPFLWGALPHDLRGVDCPLSPISEVDS